MKKLTSLLLAALLSAAFASPGFAQLSAGGRVGIDFANLGGDAEGDSKTGFSIGVFLGSSYHKLFSVYTELQYVQKGTKQELIVTGPSVDSTVFIANLEAETKLSYLEILVPATLIIPVEGSNIRPRLYIGPTMALLLSCKVEAEAQLLGEFFQDPFLPPDPFLPVDCGDFFKRMDLGLVLGGGVDLSVGSGAITADVRYNLGLTNIDDSGSTFDVKNRVWQILVGYAFFFGG